jgi:hypothetical protein
MAAFSMFSVPMVFVRTASIGKNSQDGTCLSVADVELDARVGPAAAHVVLLLFISRKDADLGDVRLEEAVQHGVAERPSATGDEQGVSGHGCGLHTIARPRPSDASTPEVYADGLQCAHDLSRPRHDTR